jgi:agmatine deiminase
MPAEWEPHQATLLAWPYRLSDWPGKFATIPWVYGEIIRHLTRFEDVVLLVRDRLQLANAQRCLQRCHANLNRVRFQICTTDRGWMRDSGPIVVHAEGECLALDWHFNAWAKYDDWKQDDRVPAVMAKAMNWPVLQPMKDKRRIVLEGGSIDVNGTGRLLTTEECLLSDIQSRNPGFTRSDYEKAFADYLGIREVLWLNRGIVGDDTHGHVDDIARFVSETTVVTAFESNEADTNHAPLHENYKRLTSAKGLTVVKLPMPHPLVFRDQRLPASYANFYIANGVVLVPTFNDPRDREALGILGELFPDREIVGIHSVDLVWGLGTLHCMSQQLPLPPRQPRRQR